jgi:hypothetical protein
MRIDTHTRNKLQPQQQQQEEQQQQQASKQASKAAAHAFGTSASFRAKMDGCVSIAAVT